ncbi:MAG: hypothetical protein JKY48_00230 [Flavobacteriales bacterium]|nr:hypothetical protein [Flavobacteriales bacterium]
MKYTLFTGDNCHQCSHVITFMEKWKIEFRIVNIDHSEERPSVRIYAFPALFEGDELIGYGTDIKEYLSKKIPNQ